MRKIKRRGKVPSFFCLIYVACLFTLRVTTIIFYHNNYATFFKAMPHIILDGTVDLERFYASFQPAQERKDGEILKTQDIYISQNRKVLLVEAIAVEDGPPQRFFIQASGKDMRTTIRIYQGTDPIKTAGVKKLLAIVAKMMRGQHPDIAYGSTNLREFLR